MHKLIKEEIMRKFVLLILAAIMTLGFTIGCEPERQPEEPMDPPPAERPLDEQPPRGGEGPEGQEQQY